MGSSTRDRSGGYDAVAREFMRRRDSNVGVTTARAWARTLPSGGSVLDLGCAHGAPISEVLIEEGLELSGIDASPALVAAFRERFPQVQVACEPAEQSSFFGRTFDGVIAVGLLFLLAADAQVMLIHRIASTLEPRGRFLFTSREQACTWADVLTGRDSVSLGAEGYRAILSAAGFTVTGEYRDEGDNQYYDAQKL